MRVFFKKMVLDLPDVIDAEPVGELDLVESLLVKAQLGILAPGLRQLVLVKKSEFHLPRPSLPEPRALTTVAHAPHPPAARAPPSPRSGGARGVSPPSPRLRGE